MALSFIIALLAVTVAIFVNSNRFLFGFHTGDIRPEHASFIQPKDDVLNYYLEPHHKQIGADFESYRNHCLRVLAFTRYFLSLENIELDPDSPISNIITMALAYHDIALWTDGALDYLEPSVTQMDKRVLQEMRQSQQAEGDEGTLYVPKQFHWSSFEADSEIAKTIILQHHKLTSYYQSSSSNSKINSSPSKNSAERKVGNDETNGSNNDKEDQQSSSPSPGGKVNIEHMNEIVNAVRKADWADATMGIVGFGLPQSLLGEAYKQIPEAGFHNVLVEMGSRLSPNSLKGQLDILKIFKW